MTSPHILFMQQAIELGKISADTRSGGPFGAVIAKDGIFISEGRNQVVKTNDPTWHAEMEAIRNACQATKNFKLYGCTLYTSCEPCPMCAAACYWAGIERIYYASTRQDAADFGGFDDSMIYEELKLEPEKRKITLLPWMREEALVVWKQYQAQSDHVHY